MLITRLSYLAVEIIVVELETNKAAKPVTSVQGCVSTSALYKCVIPLEIFLR